MALVNKIKELFQKRLQEQLTSSESDELDGILLNKENEFAIKQTLFEQLKEFKNYPEDSIVDFEKQTHDFYLKIKNLKTERENSKRFWFEFKQKQNFQKILRVAAVFILLTAFSFMFFYYIKGRFGSSLNTVEALSQFVVTAPLGAKSSVVLPDGSNVWLNAGSTLKYSTAFNTSNRVLELEGEAYFDVAKNERIPFEVKTSEISITALGTKFNVKAYSDEDFIETTLVEGKVKITKKGQPENGKGVLLAPNQTATYIKESSEIISEKHEAKIAKAEKIKIKKGEVLIQEEINSKLYTSWKDTRWQLEAEELSSLAKKLERKFNVKVEFKNKNLMQYKFTGTLEDETLEQVLEAIKLSAPIDFSIDNNRVTIIENKLYEKEFNRILK